MLVVGGRWEWEGRVEWVVVRGEGEGWCAHALAFQGALARAGRGTANHASST